MKAIGAEVRTMSPGFIAKVALGEGVARSEDVAVEVDAALGEAGGAAGEGDQRGIVGGGVDRRKGVEVGDLSLEFAVAIVAVIFDEVLDEAGLVHARRGSRR